MQSAANKSHSKSIKMIITELINKNSMFNWRDISVSERYRFMKIGLMIENELTPMYVEGQWKIFNSFQFITDHFDLLPTTSVR